MSVAEWERRQQEQGNTREFGKKTAAGNPFDQPVGEAAS
jgi:hypothetical protein